MGTRGAWGFRLHDEDKLTYNHWDSYPSGLGATMLQLVRDNDDERLAGTATRLVVLSEDAKPTAADKERYGPLADLGVSERSLNDWYSLIRGGQGEPGLYVDGTYDHCYNGNEFMADSLFCEWAYVINMDTRMVEVYKGFNKNPEAPGRYAALSHRDYSGVALLAELPIDDIRRWSDDDMAKAIALLEAEPDEED